MALSANPGWYTMFFKKRKQLRAEKEFVLDERVKEVKVRCEQLAYISTVHKYMYMSVPKIACTTLKRVVLAHEGFPLVDDHLAEAVHYMGDDLKMWNFTHEQLREILLGDWYRWCFVRNPYDRLLSAWKSKIRDDDIKFLWLRGLIFKQNGGRVITFRDFVEFICTTDDHRTITEAHIIDQSELLVPEWIQYTKIGRFENFADDVVEILDHIGAENLHNIGLMKTNYTNYIPLSTIYTQDLADMVYEQSKAAFAAFGYDKDSWQ